MRTKFGYTFIMRTKKIVFIIISVMILIVGSLWFTPYIKNLRQHYSYIYEARGDQSEKDNQKALSNYIFAKYLYPNDSIRYKIGLIYLSKDNKSVAEREFQPIKQNDIRLKVSSDYLRISDIENANEFLQTLPATDEVLYNKSLISLFQSDSYGECSAGFEKCNKLRNNSKLLLENSNVSYKNTAIAELLYKEGFEDLALKKLEAQEYKDYRDYYYLLGRIYLEKRLYNKSAVALENTIHIDPHYLPAYILARTTYQRLGNNEKANLIETKIKTISTDSIKF